MASPSDVDGQQEADRPDRGPGHDAIRVIREGLRDELIATAPVTFWNAGRPGLRAVMKRTLTSDGIIWTITDIINW